MGDSDDLYEGGILRSIDIRPVLMLQQSSSGLGLERCVFACVWDRDNGKMVFGRSYLCQWCIF